MNHSLVGVAIPKFVGRMLVPIGLVMISPTAHRAAASPAAPAPDTLSAAFPRQLAAADLWATRSDIPPPPPNPEPKKRAAVARATPQPANTLAPMVNAVQTVTAAARAQSLAAHSFTYGYCTWWVAQKRYIPWSGDAWQWWGNARLFGYSEGSRPQVGAIMVEGISYSSPVGHVAYVESVSSDGSFTVSEMNYHGWAVVDYRHITSMAGIVGFIYRS
jgi:surface antigen